MKFINLMRFLKFFFDIKSDAPAPRRKLEKWEAIERRDNWIKKRMKTNSGFFNDKKILREHGMLTKR